LQHLVDSLQPLADDRHLFLRVDGPDTLLVEGDAVKTRRIAQNLVLNALKYTARGGVEVSFGLLSRTEVASWVICVQDTGAGVHEVGVTPLAQALSEATQDSREVAREAAVPLRIVSAVTDQAAPTLPSASGKHSTADEPGEGIGLAIVKRLCELLDATLEVDSPPGRGTTFRVVLPLRYEPKRS
jgi:signal transduction histidine kinase